LKTVLVASNCAGIAFSNTGVGAVHALSYPIGGKYHVPHGLSNYLFFTEIFKLYAKKNPSGTIKELNRILSGILDCDTFEVYDKLEKLLGKLLQKERLSSYGMKEREVEEFAKSVIANQQRLLANNYVPLSDKEIENIYRILL
jgi:4-hydroxybutyrate dehydrogenase